MIPVSERRVRQLHRRWSSFSKSKLCTIGNLLLVLLLLPSWTIGQNEKVRSTPAPTRPDSSSARREKAEQLLAEARQLAAADRLDEAEKALRKSIALDTASGDAHFLLGEILFRQIQAAAIAIGKSEPSLMDEKARASLRHYTEGARYRQPSSHDLEIVSLDYILLGDYSDADKWLTKSLEWNPKNPEGWYYLGRTKYSENRFQEAIAAFQKCLDLDPNNVKAEDNLGLSYAGLGDNEHAIAAYKAAIAWQAGKPERDAGPMADLGSLLLDLNRIDEAIPYLQNVAREFPNDAKGHELLGKAYERQNQLPKAQFELEEAVKLNPGSAALHYLLGQVYRKLGIKDRAEQEFARSSELNAAHPPPQGH